MDRSPVVSSPVVSGLRPRRISAFYFLLSALVKPWLPLALFSVLWLDLIRQLSYQWSNSEQYAYGWFVPLLALGLFLKKWPTRPRDRSQSGAELLKPIATLPAEPEENPWALGIPIPIAWSKGLVIRWNFVVTTFVAFAALLILPVRVVYEANPDWPLCSWLLALIVVTITLYAFHVAGSQPVVRGQWSLLSPWVRHFAFPICFILIAVRWPYRIEHGITDGLMRMVAGFTVSVLSWFDIISSQRSNLIELSTGAVGIDEACSGIRSFQSTMMGALFLGELYLLSWRRRLGLVAGGVLLAVCFNVARTLVLTWRASETGIDALKKWHDPAGFAIFGATFACLWLLAWWFKRRIAAQALADEIADYGRPMNFKPNTGVPDRRTSPLGLIGNLTLRRLLLAAGCWTMCVLVLNAVWYVAHERAGKSTQRWYASLPTTNSTFQTVALTPRVQEMLQNDETITGTWRQQDGMEWSVFFLRWNPKSVPSVIRARGHRPEACLPGAGFREISRLPIEYSEAGLLKLPLQRYIFEANRQLLYVFFCQWQDGDEAQSSLRLPKGQLGVADRLQLARQGKRRMGQQTLEIVVSGCENFQKAEQQVRNWLPGAIRLGQADRRMVQNAK